MLEQELPGLGVNRLIDMIPNIIGVHFLLVRVNVCVSVKDDISSLFFFQDCLKHV